jgi:hypothetical protein
MYKEALMANLIFCPGIFLEELRKTRTNLKARDLNPGPPEYEAEALTATFVVPTVSTVINKNLGLSGILQAILILKTNLSSGL